MFQNKKTNPSILLRIGGERPSTSLEDSPERTQVESNGRSGTTKSNKSRTCTQKGRKGLLLRGLVPNNASQRSLASGCRRRALKVATFGILFFCLFLAIAFAAPPCVVSISPSSGSSQPNKSVTFTTTFFDFDGWRDIKYVSILITTSAFDVKNCFYALYDLKINGLYLRNDSATSWLGGYIPGFPSSKNIIENSYAKLDCSKTTVSGSGDILTVKWNVTFKPAFAGTQIKKIYLYVEDKATDGDCELSGTWLVGTNSKPSVDSFLPVGLSSQPGAEAIFYTFYTDPNGGKDIGEAYFLINTSINGKKCFYGYYNQNTNKLYLRNDADTAWLGGFRAGSNNVIENSYVKLDCSKSNALDYGNALDVKWAVTFKSTFLGLKNVYLYVKDDSGAYNGWIKKGTWLIDAIDITLLSPMDKSRYIENMLIRCVLKATSAGSQYQYQFLVDGEIRRPFNTSNTWDWQCNWQDIGIHTLTVQVKNQYGTWQEKSHKLIIYRRPIEP